MNSVYLFLLFSVFWTGNNVQSVAVVSKAALQTADQLVNYQTESDSNLQPDSTTTYPTKLYPTTKYANLNTSLIGGATYGLGYGLGAGYGPPSSANYGVDSGYGIGSSYGLNFVSDYGSNYGTADGYGGSIYKSSGNSNSLPTYGLGGLNYASYGTRNVNSGYGNYGTSPVDDLYNREAYPKNQLLYVPTPCSDLGKSVY